MAERTRPPDAEHGKSKKVMKTPVDQGFILEAWERGKNEEGFR
jgi:hypothetical protein